MPDAPQPALDGARPAADSTLFLVRVWPGATGSAGCRISARAATDEQPRLFQQGDLFLDWLVDRAASGPTPAAREDPAS